MEFKGTKGKWVKYVATIPSIENPTKHSVYVGTKRIALCYDLFENDKSKNVIELEGSANALLISKAPEMLDMLTNTKTYLEQTQGNSAVLEDIKKLIKEATEL
jgi:hypothetical protein